MNKHLPTHRNAILERITIYPHTAEEAAISGGPVTTWVAVTHLGQLGTIITQGPEKADVMKKLAEDGWKITKVVNDWN